jgi:capsular polysaccharide export protein
LADFELSEEPAPPLSDAEVDTLIDRLAQTRVGGTFWAAQPDLGEGNYILILGEAAAKPEAFEGRTLIRTDGTSACDPWHLLAGALELRCRADNHAMRLLAGIVGIPVGTHDAVVPAEPLAGNVVRDLLRKALSDRLYRDPFGPGVLSWAQLIDLLADWRRLIDLNRGLTAIYGFAGWKRATTEPLLWDGSHNQRFDRDPQAVSAGEKVATWKSRSRPAVLAMLEKRGAILVEVEDGFIRSAGLGADCVPPQSIVVDDLGVHFDARSPSQLEQMMEDGGFEPALLDRARVLRNSIRTLGISKYDVGSERLERRSTKLHVLVPGQVEDDRAVLSTPGDPIGNLELLHRVRAARPDAHLIYKPHPDVEAGHRKGGIPDSDALAFADEVVRAPSISSWIDLVDEVHVNSSLAGFEALMRDRKVTTYGVPFYAGWGLTEDLGPVPERRTARRNMDELAAAVLIVYPRYVDPLTNLPCSPETLIARLAETPNARFSLMTLARRLQGQVIRRLPIGPGRR